MKNEDFRLYPEDLMVLRPSTIRKMVFFRRTFIGENYTLVIKPLSIERDVPSIYQWMGHAVVFGLAQPKRTRKELKQHYMEFMESCKGHSLVVFMKSKMIAQIDFFHISYNHIKDHYAVKEEDHGINMLMWPDQSGGTRLPVDILITTLSFLFTLSIDRVIVYSGTENETAGEILSSAGFTFMKPVQLGEGTVNLYSFERNEFFEKYP